MCNSVASLQLRTDTIRYDSFKPIDPNRIRACMAFGIKQHQKIQFGIIAGLLFLLPITMGTVASTASAIFIVLFVMALIQPRQNWKPTEKYEWLLIILFISQKARAGSANHWVYSDLLLTQKLATATRSLF
jgi:hypothetical protein